MPVSHVGLTVSHLPTSCSFFLAALSPLGYRYQGQQDNQIGFGVDQADFFICQQSPGYAWLSALNLLLVLTLLLQNPPWSSTHRIFCPFASRRQLLFHICPKSGRQDPRRARCPRSQDRLLQRGNHRSRRQLRRSGSSARRPRVRRQQGIRLQVW